MPDASVREHAHQIHKRSNASGSGRDPAAHHIQRWNTRLALEAMADGTSWVAVGRDRVRGGRTKYSVTTGPGCARLLSRLRETLRGGLGCPNETDNNPNVRSTAVKSSTWAMQLWPGRRDWAPDGRHGPEGQSVKWQAAIRRSYMRPDAGTLARAYRTWFSCGRRDAQAPCDAAACPSCWVAGSGGAAGLANTSIEGSKDCWHAPHAESSGTGRWRGGAVETAGQAGAEHGWALGQGGGEDVEIYVNPRALATRSVGLGNVTIGRILYFFTHVGNKRPNGTAPTTKWVAVYEYVSTEPGDGAPIRRDSATQHPVFALRAEGGRSRVFPIKAIRRHVSMIHACPLRGQCKPAETARGPVLRHHYKLAGERGRAADHYLLNEHQHSVCRPDSFL